MMHVDYSPYDPAVHADPYPVYAHLRRHAPVWPNERLGFWALSRHADVSAALRDVRLFSSANGTIIEPPAWGPNAHRFQSLLAMDPPGHTRIRSLAAAHFTRGPVTMMEPLVRRVVLGYLGPVLEAGHFDLVADFAAKLPADVLSALVGVPAADQAEIGRLARLAAQCAEPGHDIAAARIEAALALSRYYRSLVAERSRRRADDLVSALLDARIAGQALTAEEIVTFLGTLSGAANDTVVHLIASAWYLAWRHPDVIGTARGDIQAWIAETLRYETPTQFTARTLTRPTVMHGVSVPAQAQVLLLLGAANHDPDVFADPERYDLHRDNSASIAFGKGRHLCLGAGIARLIARVTLEELAGRVAGFEIDEAGVRRAPAAEIRGFVRLPTTVTVTKGT